MIKQYQLTSQGRSELEKELSELKAQRGAIAEKIANARDYGDLSENAEYDAARDEQVQVESRISEIEDILQNASIIKVRASNKIIVGNTVELKTNGKNVKYTIVGPVEADPLLGKISNESPIGQSLIGCKVGDKVTIDTPRGKVEYEVIRIS